MTWWQWTWYVSNLDIIRSSTWDLRLTVENNPLLSIECSPGSGQSSEKMPEVLCKAFIWHKPWKYHEEHWHLGTWGRVSTYRRGKRQISWYNTHTQSRVKPLQIISSMGASPLWRGWHPDYRTGLEILIIHKKRLTKYESRSFSGMFMRSRFTVTHKHEFRAFTVCSVPVPFSSFSKGDAM